MLHGYCTGRWSCSGALRSAGCGAKVAGQRASDVALSYVEHHRAHQVIAGNMLFQEMWK